MKYYYCQTCNYGTYYKRNYDVHMTSPKHLNFGKVKEYKCQICNKIFNKATYLYQHTKVHQPNKYKYIRNLKIINQALSCSEITKDEYFLLKTFKTKYEEEFKKNFETENI